VLNDAVMAGTGGRTLGCQATGDRTFGQRADELREPLFELEPIDSPA
jgi:hypothetical protein